MDVRYKGRWRGRKYSCEVSKKLEIRSEAAQLTRNNRGLWSMIGRWISPKLSPMEFDLAVRIEDFREARQPRSSIASRSIVDSSCVHLHLFVLFFFSDVLLAPPSSSFSTFFSSYSSSFIGLCLLTTPLLSPYRVSSFSPFLCLRLSSLFTKSKVRCSRFSAVSLLDIRTRASSPSIPSLFYLPAWPFSLVVPPSADLLVALIVNSGGNSRKKFESRGPLERHRHFCLPPRDSLFSFVDPNTYCPREHAIPLHRLNSSSRSLNVFRGQFWEQFRWYYCLHI